MITVFLTPQFESMHEKRLKAKTEHVCLLKHSFGFCDQTIALHANWKGTKGKEDFRVFQQQAKSNWTISFWHMIPLSPSLRFGEEEQTKVMCSA